ncbi:MAG: MurR/RpiR family transcriptional regulator [Tabrizicola sp.]|nr:MurR/RpiR family transcriptional regulator [Tabrizicola sp.]
MDGPAPPKSVDEVRQRLTGLRDLPKRMQQCADHLAANLDRIAVSTVAELAAGAGVAPSALMRFCTLLGFQGFSDLQRPFREALAGGLPDYATRLRNLKQGGGDRPAALVAEFIESGRRSLENLAQGVDKAALSHAVSVLAGASTLHLVGLRRAYPVAAYLAYVCEKLTVPAMLHDAVGGVAQSHALRRGDALLAISFSPYSKETLDLASKAIAAGLPVVALTDSLTGPLARLSTVVLTVEEVDFGAFRALSATLALALGLAVAVAARREA